MTGIAARENPFRFSTKRANDPSDLLLYEYRACSPSTGRWLSRDPIAGMGHRTLKGVRKLSPGLIDADVYGFVKSDPLQRIDADGLRDQLGCCAGPGQPPHSHPDCEQICELAGKEFDGYIPLGSVICFGNKKCPCLFSYEKVGYQPRNCPAIDDIIMEHEMSHLPHSQCDGKCRVMYATPPKEMDWAAEECKQRRKTLDELRRIEGTLLPECAEVARRIIEAYRIDLANCPWTE